MFVEDVSFRSYVPPQTRRDPAQPSRLLPSFTADPQPWPFKRYQRATILHTLADDRGHLSMAALGRFNLRLSSCLITSSHLPDPPGVDIVSRNHLRREMVSRSFGSPQRYPLLGWDLAGHFGRLALRANPTHTYGDNDPWHVNPRSAGQMSLTFMTYKGEDGEFHPSLYFPRLIVKEMGPAYSYFWQPTDFTPKVNTNVDPAFVDLHVMASALCSTDLLDLEDACDFYGIPGFDCPCDSDEDRLLSEITLLARLWTKLTKANLHICPDIPPDRIYSFGTIANQALARAGIASFTQRLNEIKPNESAKMCEAFYGPRFDARPSRKSRSIIQLDISACYPTVLSLLNLTAFFTSRHISKRQRSIEEFRDFLLSPNLSNSKQWAKWGATFVKLRPHGEWLPIYRQAGEGVALTFAPFDFHGANACYHWTDIVAAVIMGADPAKMKIDAVFSLVPVGVPSKPPTIAFTSDYKVPLDDLGDALRQWRESLAGDGRKWLVSFAKGFANSICYGNLARVDRESLKADRLWFSYTPSHRLKHEDRHPQKPGPYSYLPLAACVTGGARLLLAMASGFVESHG